MCSIRKLSYDPQVRFAGVFIRPPLLLSLLRGTSSIRGPKRTLSNSKESRIRDNPSNHYPLPRTIPNSSPTQDPSLNKCPRLPLTNDGHRCLRNTSDTDRFVRVSVSVKILHLPQRCLVKQLADRTSDSSVVGTCKRAQGPVSDTGSC